MQHSLQLLEIEHAVALSRAAEHYCLHWQGQTLAVQLQPQADGSALLQVGKHAERVFVASHGDQLFVHLGGEAYALRYQHPLERLAALSGGATEDLIRAPMPGSLVSVLVAAGDSVSKGQTMLVMESMKMETAITAPRDGVVAKLGFDKGQSFDRDALLIALEPQAVTAGGKP